MRAALTGWRNLPCLRIQKVQVLETLTQLTPQLLPRPERGASVGSFLLHSPSVLPSIREESAESSETALQVLSNNLNPQEEIMDPALKTRIDQAVFAAAKVDLQLGTRR